jgi:hypothetical protein
LAGLLVNQLSKSGSVYSTAELALPAKSLLFQEAGYGYRILPGGGTP